MKRATAPRAAAIEMGLPDSAADVRAEPRQGADVEIAGTIHAGAWTPRDGAAAERAARLALLREPAAAPRVAIDITLTDDAEQQRLNRTWRGKDSPTNVLAFPGADPSAAWASRVPVLLGDVVLALSTIRREANEQGKLFPDHLRHLVIHGVLHLIGFDHQNAGDAAAMEAREIALLAELGVPDPYRGTI